MRRGGRIDDTSDWNSSHRQGHASRADDQRNAIDEGVADREEVTPIDMSSDLYQAACGRAVIAHGTAADTIVNAVTAGVDYLARARAAQGLPVTTEWAERMAEELVPLLAERLGHTVEGRRILAAALAQTNPQGEAL